MKKLKKVNEFKYIGSILESDEDETLVKLRKEEMREKKNWQGKFSFMEQNIVHKTKIPMFK